MATDRPHETASHDANEPRVIALINQKGGVGKTTTTVNLAAALARKGRRVVIIDLDPQAHASLHLGIETEGLSLYDLLVDTALDPLDALVFARENLWLIPSVTDLAAAEGELAELPDRHTRLDRVVRALRDRADYVLIDCPPSLGMLTINALVAAGDVIIPMQAQFLALQGVGKLLETITLVADNLNGSLRVAGVILCMFDGQTTHAQEVVADLESFFSDQRDERSPWRFARVYQPPIRRNVKVAECPSFGQSIFEYSPTAAGAVDYARLADELMREWEAWTRDRRSPARPAIAAQVVTSEPPLQDPKPRAIEDKRTTSGVRAGHEHAEDPGDAPPSADESVAGAEPIAEEPLASDAPVEPSTAHFDAIATFHDGELAPGAPIATDESVDARDTHDDGLGTERQAAEGHATDGQGANGSVARDEETPIVEVRWPQASQPAS